VSANLPLELVQKLLGSDSPLLELRFSPSLNIQSEVLAVYHSLLNLKNIPLLQEAYRYVVSLLVPCVHMYMHICIFVCIQKVVSMTKVCGINLLNTKRINKYSRSTV
jgi:hypothetical protein